MSKPTTIGSLFAGIGGFDLAAHHHGLTTSWTVEIDPFCRNVLEARFPNAEHHTDVNEVSAMPASKLTAEQFRAATASYLEGRSLAEIADHLPITRQALWERFKRAGVTMREQQRHGADNHFYRGGAKGADWAHNKLEAALKRGTLTRPETCESCRTPGTPYSDGRTAIQGHHDNYNAPLNVRWLCQRCHHEWHKTNEPVPLEVMPSGSLPPVDVLCGGFP